MAIIVDKEQKRKDIALSCKDLFISKGIKNLTIAQIATEAGVGKGTIYDYFKNKEDIVFEIVHILMDEHNAIKEQRINEAKSTKAKIKIFFDFFYNPQKAELREIFKEFVSISLTHPSEDIQEFLQEGCDRYYGWFRAILQEGIDRGEINPIAIDLARGPFALGDGLFLSHAMTNRIDIEAEVNLHIDTLFQLIEVRP
ncbi:MAG: TetR/AcrR family transcriptional regulator [Campylobacterota bacterium]|nr:TetR/AcrR family transcriptional regulator [Campylobacterota bacterium]